MARTERITPLRIWHSSLFKLTLAVTVVGSASCVCPDNFEFEEPPPFPKGGLGAMPLSTFTTAPAA